MRNKIRDMLSEIACVMRIQFKEYSCGGFRLIVAEIDDDHTTDTTSDRIRVINDTCITSGRTAYEAFTNHFHLYRGKIKASEYQTLKDLSISIGRNMYEKLSANYPDCDFRLYVEINNHEGIALRFHQVWSNESPIYCDRVVADSEASKNFRIYLFSTTYCNAQ